MTTRAARVVVAGMLAFVGLVAVGATTETAQAAGSKKLTASYSKVIKSERFYLRGQVPSSGERTVKLQYQRSNGTWKTTKTRTTDLDGSFVFSSVHQTSDRTYRYYAPATGSKGSVKGDPKKITVVPQKATGFAYRYEVCAGSTFRISATFTPGRLYRDVYRVTDGAFSYQGYTTAAGHLITQEITAKDGLGIHLEKLQAENWNGSGTKTLTVAYKSVLC